MRLYYDPVATTCRPITFMAAHVELSLDLRLVSLLEGAQDAPAFRALNPQGVVPVLIDGDFQLTESTAILRYLAAEAAPQLYPIEGRQRARIDEMLGWSSTSLNVFVGVLTVYPRALGMPRGLAPATVDDMARAAEPRLRLLLDQLDAWLGTRPFCAGDALSIADFHLLSTLTLADLISFDYAPWPRVAAWIEAMRALPGWRESYAGFNGLVSVIQANAALSSAHS